MCARNVQPACGGSRDRKLLCYRPSEEIEVADVGTRIEVTTTGTPRTGVVTAVSGAMLTVRWDAGGETSLIPGPGDLTVVTRRRRIPSRPSTSKSSGKKAARTSPVGKKAVTNRTVARKSNVRKVANSRPATKAIAGKAPAHKKAASGKTTAGRKMPVGKQSGTKEGTSVRTPAGKKPVKKKAAASRRAASSRKGAN